MSNTMRDLLNGATPTPGERAQLADFARAIAKNPPVASERTLRQHARWERRHRLLHRSSRAEVAAWMRLSELVMDLALGGDEFAAVVDSALDLDEEAMVKLRDLGRTDLADAAARILLDWADENLRRIVLREVVALILTALSTPTISSIADGDADLVVPPCPCHLDQVILRHGPTAVSREQQAA